jgi:hypothetical protein
MVILVLVIQNNIHLQAAHIAGKMNILADQLSRTKILTTEWSLNREIVQTLFFGKFGSLMG